MFFNNLARVLNFQHNQPAEIYVSVKTHKFSYVDSVNVNDLKFRPIIDQIGTMKYNAAKVASYYLKPLCKNKYTIQRYTFFC